MASLKDLEWSIEYWPCRAFPSQSRKAIHHHQYMTLYNNIPYVWHREVYLRSRKFCRAHVFVHLHLLAFWINVQFNFEEFHFCRVDAFQNILKQNKNPSKITCYTVAITHAWKCSNNGTNHCYLQLRLW